MMARLPGDAQPSLFHKLYVAVAGRHPDMRPWHFQWLAAQPLYAQLGPVLASLSGDVLDVGCGYKPYRSWIPGAARYFGIDVFDGPEVDAVIEPGEPWPVRDAEFDVVLCTQVLEHVGDLELTVNELIRAVKPGGTVVISVPFMFGEHNSPHDYRRFSRHGIRRLFEDRLEIVEITPQGALGSSVGAIVLGWTYDALPRGGIRALAIAPLLPLWLLLCLVTNVLGLLVDRVDRTGLYYGNVLVHARRPAG